MRFRQKRQTSDERRRLEPKSSGPSQTLFAPSIAAALATIASAALTVAAYIQLGLEPAALRVSLPAVVVLGLSVQLILLYAGIRLRRAQETQQRDWQHRQRQLEEMATRDDLTQLQNRRFFYQRLQEELARANKLKQPLSVLMIDVDDLKAVNDEFGHPVGDAALRSFSRILSEQAGPQNVTARLGGDEFAIIMPGADRRQADEMAWRLWETLSRVPVCETDHASIYLGVSVGTSGYPWGGSTLEEIIHWADTKLYANKLERKGFRALRDPGKESRLVAAVVDVLSNALEVRDRMTHRHARRVARMAAWMARRMGMSEEEVAQVEYAAALHDIGKIGVADEILRKAAPLDEDEWREMRRHSELGFVILNGIDFLREAAEIVYAHHERYDGTGYPRGLVGEEIPVGARIFAVVDAFDAMTSRRPYRDAIPREIALMEIARNAGKQFDPRMVEAFLTMIRSDPDGFRGDDEAYGARIELPANHEHRRDGRRRVATEDLVRR